MEESDHFLCSCHKSKINCIRKRPCEESFLSCSSDGTLHLSANISSFKKTNNNTRRMSVKNSCKIISASSEFAGAGTEGIGQMAISFSPKVYFLTEKTLI